VRSGPAPGAPGLYMLECAGCARRRPAARRRMHQQRSPKSRRGARVNPDRLRAASQRAEMLRNWSLFASFACAIAVGPPPDALSPAVNAATATGSCRIRTNSSAYSEFSARTSRCTLVCVYTSIYTSNLGSGLNCSCAVVGFVLAFCTVVIDAQATSSPRSR
jgi:hypothetical protein